MPRPTWRSDGAEGATPIVGRGSSCLEGLPELLWPDFNSEDLERFGKKKNGTLRGWVFLQKKEENTFMEACTERERERVSRFYLTSHVLFFKTMSFNYVGSASDVEKRRKNDPFATFLHSSCMIPLIYFDVKEVVQESPKKQNPNKSLTWLMPHIRAYKIGIVGWVCF